jgi:putative DNA primase/helicase
MDEHAIPEGCHFVSDEELEAEIAAYEAAEAAEKETRRKAKGNGAAPPEPVIPFSDEALAQAFGERYAHDLRYCEKFGQWFEWDGCRWRADEKRRVFTLARILCRQQSNLAASTIDNQSTAAKLAHKVASAGAVAAVVNLSRADPQLATAQEDWDADLWLLNTPGGMVDLKTGRLRPHDRKALCSKVTAVTPGGDCPLWRRFLDQVTASDVKLQAYLQRLVGYALTGDISAQAMAFLYGTGGNGKGVFLGTLTAILADYASVAPMETFTSSPNDRHPTDLAMLRGARLVTAQETEEGRQWSENRIKALTGSDPISARFMHRDFFTYIPQFKLLMAGNHKPGLRSVDEAMRRRFNLIPFTVAIPPAQRDPQLAEKLKAEWPGILAWAVEGCLEWQRIGLCPPPVVLDATQEYFEDEDSFGRWLGECCTPDPHAQEATRDLYSAWKAWAERSGLAPGSEPKFRAALKAQGYEAKRLPGPNVSGFVGIRLNRQDYTDDPRYGG